jgi:hypothetical protein
MTETGERYVVARRALIDQSSTHRRRTWVAHPETSDEAVRAATGRGWDDWCDVIDSWAHHSDGHTAIAAFLETEHDVSGWWAQTVTVGYERIVGLRLPYQRPDGTFSASKSRTVWVNAESLRAMLLDEDNRRDLFPGIESELRSRPTSKTIRLAIGPGVAQIALAGASGGRTKVTIAHERLPSFDDVDEWRFYWNEWLDAIDEAGR